MCRTQYNETIRIYLFILAVLFICVLFTGVIDAFAWTLPTNSNGTFAYTVYDVFVNKLLQGPAGAVGAVALMVGGIISAVRSNFLGAGICSISSILLYKAPNLIQQLGFTI